MPSHQTPRPRKVGSDELTSEGLDCGPRPQAPGRVSSTKDKMGPRRSQEQLYLLREACWVNMWTQG